MLYSWLADEARERMNMEWDDVKKELLKDLELKKAYEKIDLPHSIGKMITDARIAKRLTQGRLAELAGTKQPSIARLEKGNYLPSLSFLQKIAEALNTQLIPPKFEFLEEQTKTQNIKASYEYRPNSELNFVTNWGDIGYESSSLYKLRSESWGFKEEKHHYAS
jgi:transcriptional regulator with XRE-family HTH domain